VLDHGVILEVAVREAAASLPRRCKFEGARAQPGTSRGRRVARKISVGAAAVEPAATSMQRSATPALDRPRPRRNDRRLLRGGETMRTHRHAAVAASSSFLSGLAALAWLASAAAAPNALDPLFANSFEAGLIAFGPAYGEVPQGVPGSVSSPQPLTVTLSAPAASPTFVTIVSGDGGRLVVSGGGVTVPTGQTSAVVTLNGIAYGGGPVSVWAEYGNTLGASIGVIGALNETDVDDEADACFMESPSSFSVPSWQSTPQLFARLYEAAATPTAGPPAAWSAEIGYGPAASDPRLLGGWTFFPADFFQQLGNEDEFRTTFTAPEPTGNYAYAARFSHDDGASWTYCDLDGAGSNTGLSFSTGQLGSMTVTDPYAGLVINEVDYDNVSNDFSEFVEIYNGGAAAVDLSQVSLSLVNGSNSVEYARYSLASMGTIQPGQYGVIGAQAVVNATGANVLKLDLGTGGQLIQNGAPDAVALIDATHVRLIDALSYEGEITAATIPGFPAPLDLVEGNALPAGTADSTTIDGSLSRLPNGQDTNDAATDWNFTATRTPGTANMP
jgi:hypothetical protein